MANLGTFILTNTEHKKLSELTGVEFLPYKVYQMQNLGDDLFVRIGELGEGFCVKPQERFYYKTLSDDIFVCPVHPNNGKEKKINISENGQ